MIIEYENLGKSNEKFIKEYQNCFTDVLKSGWYILGQQVEQFEQEFAKYIDSQFCIGVASGLDALILSLKALDLKPLSEIIVPSNTYIATILAIIHAGYIPVLAEPDIKTYDIDPEKIENAITKKTKVVIVVHLYGKTCNMETISEICRRRNLFLIEDCAQSHGSMFKNQKSGTFGDLSAFSFYPTKNLGALGDAGAIITNNPDLYRKIKSLRNYGSEKKYYNEYIGYNSRLDEIQAAFLRIKLRFLDEINAHKRILADLYLKKINKNYILPVVEKNYFDVYHIFNVRHSERDKLKEFLLKNDIKTEIHYPVPPHQQKALSFMKNMQFPISEEIHRTTLSLPISFIHAEKDISRIIDVINSY